MHQRTLVLPAEIRHRELDARLLQALLAVERGWHVVTGSKAEINRNIWRYPRCAYLCTTLTEKRETMLGLLKGLGSPVVGWCDEGLIYQNRDIYLARRVSDRALSRLDALVAWGNQSAMDLDTVSGKYDLAARPIGNPRFDLLRPELRGIYRRDADAHSDEFGRYILINSNFAIVNPAPESRARTVRQGAAAHADNPKLAALADRTVTYRQTIYDEFLSLLPRLAERFPDTNIVMRPHPAEDVTVWENTAREYANVHVTRDGSVLPWLMAAGAIIHNGCTTAVEAAMLDRAPIAFCPAYEEELEFVLSNDISQRCTSRDELFGMVDASLNGQLDLGDAQLQRLDQYVGNRTGRMAAAKCLDLFDELMTSSPRTNKSGLAIAGARFAALARHASKIVRRNHMTDLYVPTVFPDTDAGFISARLDALAAQLGVDVRCHVGPVAKNVFAIRPE